MFAKNSKKYITDKAITFDLCNKVLFTDDYIHNSKNHNDAWNVEQAYPYTEKPFDLVRINSFQYDFKEKSGEYVSVEEKKYNLTELNFVHFAKDYIFCGAAGPRIKVEYALDMMFFLGGCLGKKVRNLISDDWEDKFNGTWKDKIGLYTWNINYLPRAYKANTLTVPTSNVDDNDVYRTITFLQDSDAYLLVFNETKQEYNNNQKLTLLKKIKFKQDTNITIDANKLYSVQLPRKQTYCHFSNIVFTVD